MMIRTTCAICGEVDLAPEAFELRVVAGGSPEYTFVCPSCRLRVSKPADTRAVALLVSLGVECRTVAKQPHTAWPPITYDDLLGFHEQLEGCDDVMAELLPRNP
jgi:uncharacterized protein YlaI